MTGTVTVFNSAGITTTVAATDLVRPTDWNSAHNQYVTIGGNTAGASTLSGTNVEFHGGNNVTLSGDGQTIIFSAPNQTVQTQNMVSVQGSTGAIVFNNANGVTFGANASTITASHNGLTTAAQSNHSHGNPTLALTNLSGTTASNSAGLTLSLSAAAPGGGGVGLSAGTQSVSTGTVVFANSNGVSFGMSGSNQVTASYTVPSATVTVNAASNTTQNSSGTVNLSALTFQGAGVASVGLSNGSVVISVPSGGGAGDGGNVIAAGSQTGTSLGTVKFENSNGITFGMSGSTQVTASHNGLTTAAQSNHSHGNPTLALTNLSGTTASNSAGLTLSLSAAAPGGAASATAYATGNTTQSSSGTFAVSSMVVQGTGGVSAGVSNGSIVISGPTLTSLSVTGALSASSNGSTISLGVGTVTASIIGNTTQTSTGTVNLNGLVVSGAGGLSAGISAGTLILSGATGGGGGGGVAAANSQTTYTSGTFSLIEAGGAITIASTTGQRFNFSVPATSSLSGVGNITITPNGSTISISVGTAAPSPIVMSAGTTSGSLSNVVFGDSNGVSFGLNGSTITASHNGLTTAAQSNHSHGNPTLALTNLNGTTASASNGLTLSLSAAAQTVQPVAVSGQNGSYAFSTLSFSNANGISFGTSAGSAITASHNALTTARASNDAIGLNTALTANGVAWTVNSSGLSLNVPAFLTTAAQSDHSHGNPTLALTNLSGTTASNSAGLTLSLSAAAPGGGGGAGLSAGTQSVSTGTVVFANSNGITFGMSGSSQITASHNGLTQQSTQPVAVSGQNGSYAFSTLSFSNANGISFGTSAGSAVTASHNGLTTARASNDAIGLNSAFTAGPLLMTINSSGLSLNAASAAGTTSGFTGGASISGSMTHNTAGLAISLSHPAWITTAALSDHSHGNPTLALTNLSGTTASNSAGLTLSLSAAAGGGVNPAASASNGSFAFTTLNFSNANNVTFGTSVGGIITASVAAPGVAAEANAINLLGANTAGNTTATGSTIGWSGVNLTLSGTNASQIVISAPATSSIVGVSGIGISTAGSTISIYQNVAQQSFFMAMPANASTFASQVGNGTVAVYPVVREGAFSASRADIWASVSVSSSSNSSHAGVLSVYAGIYTRNGSTLSLASSGSQSYQWSNTSNNSLGSIASLRQFSIPINVNYTGGDDLWVAVMSRSSTTNANWFTASNILQSSGGHSGQLVGLIGQASDATRGPLGFGRFSASSTVLPSSMGFSQITGGQGGTASASRLMPNVLFQNFTA
jgi:hypothetical protein